VQATIVHDSNSKILWRPLEDDDILSMDNEKYLQKKQIYCYNTGYFIGDGLGWWIARYRYFL